MRPTDVLKEALQEWLKARFEQYKGKAPVKDGTPEEAFVMAWGALGESIKSVNSMRTLPIHEQLEWSALAMLVDCDPKHIYVVKQQYPEMVVVNIVIDVADASEETEPTVPNEPPTLVTEDEWEDYWKSLLEDIVEFWKSAKAGQQKIGR